MAPLDPHHCSLGLAGTPYNARIATMTSKDSPRQQRKWDKNRADSHQRKLLV